MMFIRTDGTISATSKTPVDDVSHIVLKFDESKAIVEFSIG